MFKQLRDANAYMHELAALCAHYDSVRKHAIGLLDKDSISILDRVVAAEGDNEIGTATTKRLQQLENDKGLLGCLFQGKT